MIHDERSAPAMPFNLEGTNLARLREALARVSWSDFYTQLDDLWFAYRATPEAIGLFGHANLAYAVSQMTSHDEGEAADAQFDRAGFTGFEERLILLRLRGEPAVHVLTQTECQAALQQLLR